MLYSPRSALTILASMLSVGCGHFPGESLRPVPPPITAKSVKAVVIEARKPANQGDPITLDEVKTALTSFRAAIIRAAEGKNAQSWDAGLTTLMGGSMATIGSVASRTGLTNTGLLLAFLGLTGEQFYKPSNTIETHLDADARLSCLEDELFGVTEAERELAESATDAPGADEAKKAVDTALQATSTALLAYRRSLMGIRPGTPSRAELLDFLRRYQEDQAAKAIQPSPKGIDEETRRTSAAAKFIGLSSSLQACTKPGVPPTK